MRDKLSDMSFTVPLIAVPTLLVSMWGGLEAVERIATKQFVLAQIRISSAPIERQLSDIRASQIDQQLRELGRVRCEGQANERLNSMIRRLEREYQGVTGQVYQAMPCEFLVSTAL